MRLKTSKVKVKTLKKQRPKVSVRGVVVALAILIMTLMTLSLSHDPNDLHHYLNALTCS